jgi:hypothetical protein
LALIPIIALSKDAKCEIWTGSEFGTLSADDTYRINPAKYICSGKCAGNMTFSTTLYNLLPVKQSFDMGDGEIISLEGNSSIEYLYKFDVSGLAAKRIYIKKVQTGFMQNGLIFKVERR